MNAKLDSSPEDGVGRDYERNMRNSDQKRDKILRNRNIRKAKRLREDERFGYEIF